jgi:cytochrome c556
MKKIKNLLSAVSFALFAFIFLSNCAQESEKKAEENRYPADSSELSRLMRSMWSDSDLMKKAVTDGKMPDDFREKFTAIHTAIPTDADTKKENFDAMAKSFLASMDKLYATQENSEELKNAFNLMVEQCVNCHQSHCPGPIVKIKKLTIHQ